jgi:protease I
MNKRALMVIAPNDFRDEEFFDTKKVLEESEVEVIVVNSTGQPSKSMFGKIVSPDKNFYNVNSDDYDAIVFIGGQGTPAYFDNKQAQNLAKEFNESGKIVAAICIAPVILARAGILSGKKATVFPSGRNDIKAVGTYTGNKVEKDDNIITGCGPEAAVDFGKAIVEALK